MKLNGVLVKNNYQLLSHPNNRTW